MLKYFRNRKVPVFMTPTIKMDIADKLIEKVMNCVFILGKMDDICKGSAEITYILVVNLKVAGGKVEINILNGDLLGYDTFKTTDKSLADIETSFCVIENWNGRDETVDDHYITICYPQEM